ncbi:M14 family zinc carboxypeptidase [Luteibaculum oceani]|uniref:Peptidase M14 domain-containing protein n=1 Tax=Luteibaculum oceani TaxID=1294296 RepID=A0A5C6VA54_9FLAO|nr:M14 family zinc carboxypeptidase [Luteibaculum oceani]TXC82137.1 hypothetical protein FRX97_03315 [Luteibaculum oceani]
MVPYLAENLNEMTFYRWLVLSLISLFFIGCESIELKKSFPETKFEKSYGLESSDYRETISFWNAASKICQRLQIDSLGETDSGFPLHLVKWNEEGGSSGRKIFIINGIHAGEPDGIDACQLLIKEIEQNEQLIEEFKDIALYIIPVYNIGGALNRNSTSRANQAGPRDYGFRGNAQNLDLNRDNIKMDSKNAALLAVLLDSIMPTLFIDNHVSNGADYQHVITLLTTQEQKLGGPLESVYSEFTKSLYPEMESAGYPMVPYVNVWGRAPQDGGIEQFFDWPRYTTGMAALHHIPGYTVETHMLKPFKERVLATKAFMHVCMRKLASFGDDLVKAQKQQVDFYANADSIPVNWELNKTIADSVYYAGYQYVNAESRVGKFPFKIYDRDSLWNGKIPYYNSYTPNDYVKKPSCYIIKAGYHQIVSKLQAHGVSVNRVTEKYKVWAEKTVITSWETSSSVYEKHFPHYNVSIESAFDTLLIEQNDFIIKTGGKYDRILAETLEPTAFDSYFKWNAFDAILQRKEGFSPYVWDKKAAEILNTNQGLEKEFNQKLNDDIEFRNSHYQQLQWIYERSEYSESAYLQYPVYKVY